MGLKMILSPIKKDEEFSPVPVSVYCIKRSTCSWSSALGAELQTGGMKTLNQSTLVTSRHKRHVYVPQYDLQMELSFSIVPWCENFGKNYLNKYTGFTEHSGKFQ